MPKAQDSRRIHPAREAGAAASLTKDNDRATIAEDVVGVLAAGAL